MNLTPSERKEMLEKVFPDYCDIIGPKNLNKVCQDDSVQLVKAEKGSNMMFSDIIITLFQAVDFLNNALGVYTTLSKKEAEPRTIVNNTIQIINIGKSEKLSEEAQLKLAELILEYGNREKK